MEIRVIHLARATARQDRMQTELAAAGLQATAWAAVDGRDPANAARLAALPDHGPWGAMEAHAKGCLLSHRDAMAAFLDGDASHMMVLEDDAFLAVDLADWTRGDWWPEGADIVKIERWRDDRLLVLLEKTGPVHGGRMLRRMRSRHSGSAGYIVTRAAAERVLADRRDLPADHLLFNPTVSALARQLSLWQVLPALAVQGNEPPTPAPHSARPKKSLGEKLRRGAAEMRALAALPHLLTGRARLTAVAFAAAARPQASNL